VEVTDPELQKKGTSMRAEEKREGLTLKQFLTECEGMCLGITAVKGNWDQLYAHWNQHNPLGWAVHCFLKSKRFRRLF